MKRALLVPLLLLALAPSATAAPAGQAFFAHLSGAEEVPPVETDAAGEATFQVNKAGTAVSYRLVVANIEDVTQAHIHCRAPEGSNAQPAVFLYGPAAPGGPVNGVLAEGSFSPLLPCPTGGGTVLQAMRDGQAYANVHTSDHGGGEIRGQIEQGGPPA